MSAIKLHVIKPSVNNMTARWFVRAAKLDFTEDDVYGKTRTDEFLAKNPAHLTPMMEAAGLPKGVVWESCAIMQYLCNKHHLVESSIRPTRKSGRWWTARCSISSAPSIPISLGRRMARSASRSTQAKLARSDASATEKDQAQKAALAALGETLEVFRKFYLDGKTFIGGDHPSIADIRLTCSLEFLNVIDYAFPDWAKTYMATVETTLGDAYAEPAGDVEGYIAYVKAGRRSRRRTGGSRRPIASRRRLGVKKWRAVNPKN